MAHTNDGMKNRQIACWTIHEEKPHLSFWKGSPWSHVKCCLPLQRYLLRFFSVDWLRCPLVHKMNRLHQPFLIFFRTVCKVGSVVQRRAHCDTWHLTESTTHFLHVFFLCFVHTPGFQKVLHRAVSIFCKV